MINYYIYYIIISDGRFYYNNYKTKKLIKELGLKNKITKIKETIKNKILSKKKHKTSIPIFINKNRINYLYSFFVTPNIQPKKLIRQESFKLSSEFLYSVIPIRKAIFTNLIKETEALRMTTASASESESDSASYDENRSIPNELENAMISTIRSCH